MDWISDAVCARLPLSEAERLFFSGSPGALSEARRLCLECPVRPECRERVDSLEVGFLAGRHHSVGVWAAETPTERRQRRAAIA